MLSIMPASAQSLLLGAELREKASKSQTTVAADLQNYSFINSDKNYFGPEEKENQISTVGAHIVHRGKRWQADGRWFFVPQEEFHYLSLSELSYTRPVNDGRWILGRHQMSWSHLDETWGMTLWQPRMTWDRLRPETQGFTGAFWQQPLSNTWDWTLFASGVFQPDLGPRYREKAGKITSVNPWFRTPPRTIELWEVLTPVVVQVNEPETKDVVMQPHFATQLKWTPTDSVTSQVSYAYKPNNFARVGYNYFLRMGDSELEVDVDVVPDFPYHHIVTWENVWQREQWSVAASATYDDPQMPEVVLKRIAQYWKPSTIAGLSVQWTEVPKSSVGWVVDAGVLNVWGDRAADVGEYAQATTQFEERLPFRYAGRLGLQKTVSRKASRFLSARGEGVYDMKQEGGFFLGEVSYGAKNSWQVRARLDLIGATTDEKNDYEKGFLRTYKANDNLSVGFNYVF
jgi:hypothetical protein